MTIQDYAERWGVVLEARLPGSTCSEVWRGVWEGREVVLKLPRPDAEEAKSLPVLRAFSQRGGVEVLKGDEATGACLLPLLGSTLDESDLGEARQNDIFVRLAFQIRSAPIGEAMTYEIYAADAFASNDEVLREPIRVISHLLDTCPLRSLIHGDLHHFNILKGEKGYVAIDPKGIVTDPAAEIVAYVRNPDIAKLMPEKVRARIVAAAEAWGVSYDRLWSWAWAGNAISFWWNDPQDCTRQLAPILAARSG